jgi:hypothetical protein
MATYGHHFKDQEVLNLQNNYGFTVADFQTHQKSTPSLDV